MSDKQTLRRMIRLRKQQHTADESPVIIERLKQNAHFLSARTLLLYYALPDEVQTQHLIDELVKQGKTVLLPRVVSDTDMELCRYTGQQDLKKGGLNVWEPWVSDLRTMSRLTWPSFQAWLSTIRVIGWAEAKAIMTACWHTSRHKPHTSTR